MNRRILKKQCKRAMAILIAEHGYRPKDFSPARGDEHVDAPGGMEARFVHRDGMTPGPLKGTPLLWCKVSDEYDEWKCRLPSEWLRDLIFWAYWRPSAAELAEMGQVAA